MSADLTIVICTHNRVALLERTLASLNRAARPQGWHIDVLAIANACTDDTVGFLRRYQREASARSWLPLRFAEEPRPGKSRALNVAIDLIRTAAVTYVDDDHRVDDGYLAGVCRALEQYPEASLFCGRVIPDWDGSEPDWVHEAGAYRIYPLPVPHFELGDEPMRVKPGEATPGGGNLCLRTELFARVGRYSVEFGPTGHDLAGGEDTEWVRRAIAQGAILQYVPEMLQYHYVDRERLTLSYVMRKSYQRSSSYVRLSPMIGVAGRVPAYMYRKLGTYVLSAVSSLGASRRRFYLVRSAAALGEIRGVLSRRRRHLQRDSGRNAGRPDGGTYARAAGAAFGMLAALAFAAGAPTFEPLVRALGMSLLVGVALTLLLLIKSLIDFTRTGPHITQEVLSHYRLFLIQAMGRLSLATFLLVAGMAFLGGTAYVVGLVLFGGEYDVLSAAVAGTAGVLVLSVRAFLRALLYNPGVIAASSQYAMARFYSIWERLNPQRLRMLDILLVGTLGPWFVAGVSSLWRAGSWEAAGLIAGIGVLSVAITMLAAWRQEPRPVRPRGKTSAPNILMIGSDTLRADRINGYRRDVIPNLSRLFKRATLFTDCYVPCARTAPSLISMLTGTWPHTHRVRDTFVRPEDTVLPIGGLPEILEQAGYQTAVVGDWAAADLAKFNFKFSHQDLPPDQWNIKYLLRQGPKDIRLFLSLFTQNRFGKSLLPEVYYLGGVPLTEEVGSDTRRMIARLAAKDAPFFLLSFMATNHPPFSSKYPYYTLFADPKYRGPSKFAMSKLTDPYEIIRRQGEPKTEFDLDQIIDLYDGCVKNFDDEVGRILAYLDASGLAENTILVFFSDHGMEFFEHETWGQGNSAIGDFSARVPLAIADTRNRRPQLVSEVVRTVDLAPTLLDLIGLPKPNYMEGVSLAPLMGANPLPDKLPAFYETGVWVTDLPGTPRGHIRYPELPDLLEVPDKHLGTIAINPAFYKVIIAAKDRMVRLGDWKLTYQPLVDGAIWKLFNVKDDPDCKMDVLKSFPEIGAKLGALLESWMAADAANEAPRSSLKLQVGMNRSPIMEPEK